VPHVRSSFEHSPVQRLPELTLHGASLVFAGPFRTGAIILAPQNTARPLGRQRQSQENSNSRSTDLPNRARLHFAQEADGDYKQKRAKNVYLVCR